MSGSDQTNQDADPDTANQVSDDHADDQEKILDGRKDVDYPGMLTRDAPGG